jgi:mono/diheme cytochrome c family protein
MKKILHSSVLGLILLMFACTVKKPVQEIAQTPAKKEVIEQVNSYNNFSGNLGFPAPKPAVKLYPPDEAALAIIQKSNSNASMELLNHGFKLYTKGACINCHEARDINNFNNSQWGHIIDDMAIKANITSEEKNAVLNYIVSVKIALANK